MKILITGMTSQHTRSITRSGQLTLAGALEADLTALGHDVLVSTYPLAKDDKGVYGTFWLNDGKEVFDRIFVGLGPLKGLGTSYMYQAIQALFEYCDRAVLFVDDTSTQKIGREFKTVLNKPSDYTKEFFSYKRDYHLIAGNDEALKTHFSVINGLAGNDWWRPEKYWPMLVPSWSFDLAYTAAMKVSPLAADRVISFDPSPHFAVPARKVEQTDNDPYWGTMWQLTSPAINKMGVHSWDVECIAGDPYRVHDVSGMLVPSSVWSPDIFLSVSAGVPVATDWRVLGSRFGEPFEAIATDIEGMTAENRTKLAKRQLDVLQSNLAGTTQEALKAALKASNPFS